MRLVYLISAFSIFAYSACNVQAQSVTVAFTGDIMMHYAVKGCALNNDPDKKGKYTVAGFKHLFIKAMPALSAPDYTIGNMEFPVSPPFIQKELIFNCPPEVIPALKESGFDLVSLANNHILDQGTKGAFNTMGYLEKSGLPFFGVGKDEKTVREGVIFEKNGIKIGIMTYAGVMNYGFPEKNSALYINDLNEKELLINDIKRMRSQSDIVIVQPHYGVEYTLVPTEEQKILYREILDAGADMIIGHHPHALQYAEDYITKDKRSCTIFYSLGNFICNQNYTFPIAGTKERMDIRNSIIVTVLVTKTGGEIKRSLKIIPTHTIHEYVRSKKGTYKEIQTVLVADEIKSLKEKILQNKDKVASEKKLLYFRSHLSAIQKVLFKNGMIEKATMETGE
jgi:poly-gamma-glutamate capsule biosynthesis protein CapA/YwtB (metallophosphatase superfamily)